MQRRRILASIILASVAAIAVAAVTTITGKATSDRAKRCAAGLTAHTAHSLADLTALFRQQQSLYLRIALPTPDFLLRQSSGTVAFDPLTALFVHTL